MNEEAKSTVGSPNSVSPENGSVIVFVAITLVVMITYAIWVVDTSLVANAREEAQHGARLACVAALEGHLASTGNVDHRVANAVARAKNATFSHLMLSNAHLTNEDDRNKISSLNAGTVLSDTAVLVPGKYIWDKERTDAVGAPISLPVRNQGCSMAPHDNCFIPYDPFDTAFSSERAVNSYMIIGGYYSGITYKLARFLGLDQSAPVNVRSVCAVVPRHLSFVVDLSPSMKAVTHKDAEWYRQAGDPNTYGRGSEYAFFLPSDNPDIRLLDNSHIPSIYHYQSVWDWLDGKTPRNLDHSHKCYNTDCSSATNLALANQTTGLSAAQQEIANCVKNYCGNYCRAATHVPGICPIVATGDNAHPHDIAPPPASDSRYATTRYRDDYVKVQVLGDEDYTKSPNEEFLKYHPNPAGDNRLPGFQTTKTANNKSTSKGQWYRIDMNDAAGDYKGPEPLTSTLNGVHDAIEKFRDNRINGDRVSAIFFDTEISWPRIFLPTSDFDYILKVLNFDDGYGAFGKPSPAGEPLDDANNDGHLDNGINLADTSKRGFVQAIRHQLFPGVDRFGVDIYTNTGAALALASTMLNLASASTTPSQDDIVLITDGLANCVTGSPFCANNYIAFRVAYQNIFTTLIPNIRNRNVSINTLLVGDTVKPHTILQTNPNNLSECLTDEVSRLLNKQGISDHPFVAGGIEGAPTSICGANSCSTVAPYPGDPIFSAISRYNEMSAAKPFYDANLYAYQLSASTEGLWIPIRPPGIKVGTNCPPPPACTDTPIRVEYDPACRTRKEQVQQGIEKLVGTVPFMLVEEETPPQ